MAKPPPESIPSDDYEVTTADGQVYRPHEGEWVLMYLDQTVEEVTAGEALARIGVEMQAAKGDKDEALKIGLLAEQHFAILCEALAERVVDWTWTDRRGRPLPKPDGTTGPISKLSSDEMGYLLKVKASRQESEPARKNG